MTVLSNVVANASHIKDEVKKQTKFHKQWCGILNQVEESTDEFLRYHRDINVNLRIPLVHPTSDQRLRQVNQMTFRAVYCGIRYGWWAHGKLLKAMDVEPSDHYENWCTICGMVNLTPDLSTDDLPSSK